MAQNEQQSEFSSSYLHKLQSAGAISRRLKRHTTYPFFIKSEHKTVLDFGCGDLSFARYFKEFAQPGKKIDVFDINEEIRQLAKSLGFKFYSDLSKLSGKYDLIVADNVLEHIENWREVFQALTNRIEYGGSLVVGIPGVKGYASDTTHKSFITEFDIQNCADAAGCTLEKVYYYPINIKSVANIMAIYSRHVLFYYRVVKK